MGLVGTGLVGTGLMGIIDIFLISTSSFQILPVDITILPVLSRLVRLNHRMPGFFKMLCCVFVF